MNVLIIIFICILTIFILYVCTSLFILCRVKHFIYVLRDDGYIELADELRNNYNNVGIIPIQGCPKEYQKKWYATWKKVRLLKTDKINSRKLINFLKIAFYLRICYIIGFVFLLIFFIVLLSFMSK